MIPVSEMSLEYILNDYRKHFHGKRCYLGLNYTKLDSIEIHFDEKQLFHLLGLGKVTNKISATKGIEMIEKKQLTIQTVINHTDFNEIKYRILGYKSLHSMLINPKAKVCILSKDLQRNTMNLDVILWDNLNKKKMMILGIRKASKENLYYPTTLHRSERYKYENVKRTFINSILWL